MKLVVEISLYPLMDDYLQPIKAFIQRINQYPQLDVLTTATSTRIAGEYQQCMQILSQEMQVTHEQVGQAIFVCKFLNGDDMDFKTYA